MSRIAPPAANRNDGVSQEKPRKQCDCAFQMRGTATIDVEKLGVCMEMRKD